MTRKEEYKEQAIQSTGMFCGMLSAWLLIDVWHASWPGILAGSFGVVVYRTVKYFCTPPSP